MQRVHHACFSRILKETTGDVFIYILKSRIIRTWCRGNRIWRYLKGAFRKWVGASRYPLLTTTGQTFISKAYRHQHLHITGLPTFLSCSDGDKVPTNTRIPHLLVVTLLTSTNSGGVEWTYDIRLCPAIIGFLQQEQSCPIPSCSSHCMSLGITLPPSSITR